MAPEIPPERILDLFTRIDELLLLNLEATRKLTEAIDKLSAALVAPPAAPPAPPPAVPPPRIVVAPAPAELVPLTSRLDSIDAKLGSLGLKLDAVDEGLGTLQTSLEEYRRRDLQGKPVALLDRYSGEDTTYKKIAEWRVGDVWGLDKGNLREISVACETTAMYAHAQFKLTIAGKPVFKDRKVVTQLTLPFPNNQLSKGDKVTLEVRSDDETPITVDGTIIGREL